MTSYPEQIIEAKVRGVWKFNINNQKVSLDNDVHYSAEELENYKEQYDNEMY